MHSRACIGKELSFRARLLGIYLRELLASELAACVTSCHAANSTSRKAKKKSHTRWDHFMAPGARFELAAN